MISKLMAATLLLSLGTVHTRGMPIYQKRTPVSAAVADTLTSAPAQTNGLVSTTHLDKYYHAEEAFAPATEIIHHHFKTVAFGNIPDGWRDLVNRKPSRNWIVDAHGFLRHVLKDRPGLIAYDDDYVPANIRIGASFKKTEDHEVFFGIAGRIQDKDNFYAVMALSDDKLVINKVKDGQLIPLTDMVLLNRIRYPEIWEMTVSFHDDLITGLLYDARGALVARIDARDGEFVNGTYGLYCTDYTAAQNVSAAIPQSDSKKPQPPPIVPHNNVLSPLYDYPLIKPLMNIDSLNTPFDSTAHQYDVVVAGAGTGGWAASVQAARMGKRVLLLEETDWIGGQMAAAAVTSMDESGPLVRERGIYRQFHESMTAYYYGREKSPFMSYYWGWSTKDQQDGGYEPKIARSVLYGFIQNTRDQAAKTGSGGKLDLLTRTRVTKVIRSGWKVTGVEVVQWNESGQNKAKSIACKILIDATEYGDIIPLTGARYRVGNTRSVNLDPNGVAQNNTYTAVIREYPEGIPDHLKITTKPPGYETYRKTFVKRVLHGDGVLHANGIRNYRAELAWRGMADSKSPLIGELSELRHTLTGLNGGGIDYPVPVTAIESLAKRRENEREGIYRTLSKIYYYQNELRLPWAVAEDQGFNTPYNRETMRQRGVIDALLDNAKYLSQMPYVRESRRIEGMATLVADDLQRGEKAKHVPTSIAIGDYFMDLHHTYEALENDLDQEGFSQEHGPFQIPFAVFIPEKLDGFLPAEKNFSQSRLASGATRLQPITLLTGQAVGVIAALAIEKNVQPRTLDPVSVQLCLLDQGATLVPRWYHDIVWGTELWKSTQMLSLYQIMDKPGGLAYEDGMEFIPKEKWQPELALSGKEAQSVVPRLASLLGYQVNPVEDTFLTLETVSFGDLKKLANSLHPDFGKLFNTVVYDDSHPFTHGEFAKLCFRIIQRIHKKTG